MDEQKVEYDFLKANIWVFLGLLFALITPVFFVLGALKIAPLSEPGILTLLLGGLFLLIGGNARTETN